MIWHRWLQALGAWLVIFGLGACNVTMRPTRPDQALTAGEHAPGIRFATDEIEIRESGMPLSTSRSWDREVQIYTASQLNRLLSTDEMAPAIRTIVLFDSPPPPSFEFGSWKEMTIELTSVLPDGSTVRSTPVTGFIDSAVEQMGVQCLGVTGSVLDVAASLVGLVYVFSPASSELACGLFVGALVGGLTLNLAQNAAGHWSKLRQQTRWSNLYAEALEQHAEDIRQRLSRGPRPKTPPPAPAPAPPPAMNPAGSDTERPEKPSQVPDDVDDLPPPAPLSHFQKVSAQKSLQTADVTAY